jgi:enamine deaminase RidA (YjgF/YER057c/UK114 family)
MTLPAGTVFIESAPRFSAMTTPYYFHPDAPDEIPALAARAGDLVFFGGGIAAHPHSGVPDSVHPMQGYPHHWSRINRELEVVYGVMGRVFEAAGTNLHRIMKLNTYLRDPQDSYEALRVRKDYFGVETPPPSTLVVAPGLPVKDARVTTDAVALVEGAQNDRTAMTTSTPNAPMPPHERIWGYRIYSKATRGGGFLFTAGRTNNLIAGNADRRSVGHPDYPYRDDKPIVATELILEYLGSILEGYGATWEHVVRAEIHISDAGLICGIDEVWRRTFPGEPPARVFVPVNYPTDYTIIEIELIAVDPDGPFRKETITIPEFDAPVGHEPHAVKAGPLLFFSGQLATDWKHGVAIEARVDPDFPHFESAVKKQTRYILDRVERICTAAGASMTNLVRRRAMYLDLTDLGAAESVWREVLKDRVPPTTTFKILDALPVPGCLMQYDLIAGIES